MPTLSSTSTVLSARPSLDLAPDLLVRVAAGDPAVSLTDSRPGPASPTSPTSRSERPPVPGGAGTGDAARPDPSNMEVEGKAVEEGDLSARLDAMRDPAPPTPELATWTVERAHYPKASGTYRMSSHATRRMYARSLSPAAIHRALVYGRVCFARGAVHFILGRNEVERYDAVCPEDDGIQLVVSELQAGTIITVYRNPDLLPRR